MTEPQRYTLFEAHLEIARRNCAVDGHAPVTPVLPFDSFIALRWICECGVMTWVPQS